MTETSRVTPPAMPLSSNVLPIYWSIVFEHHIHFILSKTHNKTFRLVFFAFQMKIEFIFWMKINKTFAKSGYELKKKKKWNEIQFLVLLVQNIFILWQVLEKSFEK